MKSCQRYVCFGIFLVLLFGTISASAQSTLTAGDIAFTGYISTVTPDEFSFVLLRNITSGTTINFTDNSWLNTNVFRTGEQNITWTATSSLNAGQEIRISGLTASLASGPGSAGIVTGAAINLNTTGDQVLAFQGTTGAPTFLSGIHMNVYTLTFGDVTDTTAAAWDGIGSNTTTSSALPTGLTTGTTAIWVGVFQQSPSEFDNARFNCGSGPLGTAAEARTTINNQSNWTKENVTASFTLPTGCPYLAPTAAGVSLGGRVLTATGRGISKVRVSLTDSNGNVRTTLASSFGYYSFDDVEAGGTYTVTVSAKGYRFSQASVVVTPGDSIGDLDFVADQN